MKPVRIGPFEIHEAVGKGGMGVVHRGIYRGPGAPVAVAIKFVTPPDGDNPRFRDAFVREAQSAARLHHPNIVGVYDIGEVDELGAVALNLRPRTAFLVMEFVDAGTLEDEVGTLAWSELRDILLQLLDALAHAHALGIVHRDLKPANVLCLKREGRYVPMLTDFGIARAMDTQPEEAAEDEPQRVAGTPYYMAPEHVMGRWRDEGPWTDVYALGALAWHLTTGSVPFAGNTGEVLRAHLMADLPVFVPHIDVPDDFEPWVRRLLDKDLTQRFRRAADAAWALMHLPDVDEPRATTRRLRPIMAAPGPTLEGLTGSLASPDSVIELRARGAVRKAGLAPPIPADWRRGDEGDRRMLAGAGLGLFGLRPVPVVGRDAERTVLWDVLRNVHRSRGPHGAVVTGVPGAGKSRIVEWLAERAEEVGGAVVFRATHSGAMIGSDGLVPMMARFTRTRGLPFENVIMRVRALYSDLDLKGEEALFDAVALTERILGRNPEKAGGPRFQSRREWFSALYRLMGGLTRERPVLLWLDDVHWGEESLEFARYVLGGEDDESYPVMVVVTCPDLIDAPESADAAAQLRGIASLPNVETVALGPLGDEEMSDLVGRMLGLDPQLAALVVERTAGNPLFAVQIVEDWVSRGALRLTADGFAVAGDEALQLPDDVHTTWTRRVTEFVSRFDDPTSAQRALVLAAALGSTVDAGEWAAALDALGVGLADAMPSFISRLVAAGLVLRESPGIAFVHGLLRESLLHSVHDDERPALESACAQALERTAEAPFTPRRAERIAGHWVSAGEPQRAFDVLFASVLGHREVAEHSAILRIARRALDLVGQTVPVAHEVGALLLNVATALRHLGDVDQAREFIDTGWETMCEGRAATDFATHPDPDRNPILASLLTEEAIMVYENENDLARANELLEIAGDLAVAVDDAVSAGWASKIRSRILCSMGRHAAGVDAARTSVRYYGRLKDDRPDYYFSGLCELAGALRVAGEFDEAYATMEEAALWTADVGSREALALAAMESAELARATERYDEARGHYRTCGELFDALGGKNRLLVGLNYCLVDLESGDLEAPFEHLLELKDQFPAVGMHGFTPLVDLGLAACWAAQGNWPEYERAITTAREKLATQDVRDQELAGIAVIAARAALEHGSELGRAAWELAKALGGPDLRPSRQLDVGLLTERYDRSSST